LSLSQDEITGLVRESMGKYIEEEGIIFVTYEELRECVVKKTGVTLKKKEIDQAIWKLEDKKELAHRKVANRLVYFLTELVKRYREPTARRK
jgi:hypothetical protein